MPQLFQRAVKIILGEVQIENLRVQLKVKHNASKEPNTCELTVYNLSADTRAKLQSRGTRVVVEAGYVGTIAQIFTGTTTYIDHAHEGPLWLSKVLCADGEVPYAAPVKGSFKKGTSVATVFEALAKQLGVDSAGAADVVRQTVKEQFTKGYTAFGSGSVEIDKLLKGRGLQWSIQDNKLQVIPLGGHTNDTAIVISPTSGLIGSPAHGSPAEAKKTPSMLTVKSLLQPSIRPGRLVRIESETIPAPGADFICVKVTHTGDTAGGDWYSEAEVTPV